MTTSLSCTQFAEQFGYLWDLRMQFARQAAPLKKVPAPRLPRSAVISHDHTSFSISLGGVK